MLAVQAALGISSFSGCMGRASSALFLPGFRLCCHRLEICGSVRNTIHHVHIIRDHVMDFIAFDTSSAMGKQISIFVEIYHHEDLILLQVEGVHVIGWIFTRNTINEAEIVLVVLDLYRVRIVYEGLIDHA